MDEIVSRRPLSPSDLIVDHPDAVITVRKVRASSDTAANKLDFVLSDEMPDRMGDIIRLSGWQLDNFRRNPIALFGHRADFPIGNWSRLRVEDGALRGQLTLAPEGTSARIDEIRRLVEANILRAVSVGFRPIESRPRGPDAPGGVLFEKQELIETSLVAVPANPNAVIAAKALGVSAQTCRLVFAEHCVRREQSSPVTKQVDVVTKLNARIARLYAKGQAVQAELERLIARQQKCVEIACEALADKDFARLRTYEITGKALDKLIEGSVDELRLLQRYIATLRTSRSCLQKR
jgi:HK97 family phage prohead protease